MDRQYGVSIASLLPWSLGPGGFGRALSIAKQAGLKLQVLPFRGWNLDRLREGSSEILSYEDAWNFGPLWQVPLRHMGFKPEAPLMIDALLFKQALMPPIQNALHSVHDWNPNALVEVSPGLGTDVGEYVRRARVRQKYVWDTKHVSEPDKDGNRMSWVSLLSNLPDNCIKLIHAQPTSVSDFANPKSSLHQQLTVLRRRVGDDVPVILEVRPELQRYKQTIKSFTDLSDSLRRLI